MYTNNSKEGLMTVERSVGSKILKSDSTMQRWDMVAKQVTTNSFDSTDPSYRPSFGPSR